MEAAALARADLPDHRVHLVETVGLEHPDALETLVLLAEMALFSRHLHRSPHVRSALLDLRDPQAHPDLKACQVLKGTLVSQAKMVPRAPPVRKDLRGRQVFRDSLVKKAPLENQEKSSTVLLRDPPAPLAHPDLKDPLDLPELMDSPDHLDPLDPKETQVRKARMEFPDPLVLLVLVALLDNLAAVITAHHPARAQDTKQRCKH